MLVARQLRYHGYTYPSVVGQSGLDFFLKNTLFMFEYLHVFQLKFVVINLHRSIKASYRNYCIINLAYKNIFFIVPRAYKYLVNDFGKNRKMRHFWLQPKILADRLMQTDINPEMTVFRYQKQSKHDGKVPLKLLCPWKQKFIF